MARWNQEKKSHQSSGFVQNDLLMNESEPESDDMEDMTGQHGHLLANDLMQFDKTRMNNGNMKSDVANNKSKNFRKM